MAHSSLLGLVVFLTWSGAGHTASYPNLECCCSTKMYTYEGNFRDDTTQLTCSKAYSLHFIPKPLPTSLKRFEIWNQNIPNITPGDFPRLQYLEILTIFESQVVTIQPRSFETLSNLLELSITKNKITRLEAKTFRGLTKLESLKLNINRLHYIDDAAFIGLARLRKLSLSSNCLSSIPRGTYQSAWPLEFTMTFNPLTSLIAAEELRHVSRLVLAQNGLPCDCKLRDMKRWMTRNKQWIIKCGTYPYKRIQTLSLDDLKCDYKVSVSSDYGTVSGSVSLTCQTDCHEDLDLTFSWIAPNGDLLSSTREYSRTHTDVRESYCKETPVTRRETKKTCYSVLHIPTLRRGMEAMGGKGVETEAATSRPGRGLSPMQLVLVGLTPFAGCSVIVMVIVVCVSKCKGDRQRDNANGHRRRYYGNDDQISGTFSAARGVSYENDVQFSDTEGENGVHYENDDQFSDTGVGKRNDEYENDDQFSDTDCTHGGQYENNDQFSDDDDDVVSRHPRRTIPQNLPCKKPGKTSSLAKAESDRPRRNQKATRDRPKVKSNVLRVLADVHAQAQANGQYDNDKKATGLCHTAHATSSRPKAKGNVLRVLAEVHAQAQASGHYDNDTNASGINNSKATASSDNVARKHWEWRNERSEGKAGDRNMTSTSACADDVSDNDYVTFPGEENGDGKTGKNNGRKSDLDTALSNAEQEGAHTYVTFPGEENDEEWQKEAEKKGEHMPDIDTDSSNTEDNTDHTYLTFPAEENDEHERETERQNDQASDLDVVPINSDNISDHVYVTFPETENAKEDKNETKLEEGHMPDSEDSSNTEEDSSDHFYVTFPGHGEGNDEKQQAPSGKMDEPVSDLNTASSNTEENSGHAYVTSSGEVNDEETAKRDSILGREDGRTCVKLTQLYFTQK
ncbi:corticospinal neuron axon guidance through spinal cord [Branchiostoma belcheri]|nr:corticospinal neuron axon guidance through spinal cord [Branchiostoma belcheri]